MDILDKLVIPQPEYNLVLLNYFLMIGLSIFFVYTGVLFGSMILSVYFKGKSKKGEDFSSLSRDYADLAADKKSYGFGLGIVSLLSIIAIYMQLLHKINVGVVSYLLIAAILYVVSLVALFSYKYSLHGRSFVSIFKKKETEEVLASSEKGSGGSSFLAIIGIVLMTAAMWLIIGAIHLTTDKAVWGGSDIISIIVAPLTIIGLIQFVLASFGATSITLLFRKYYLNPDKKQESEEKVLYSKQFNLWIGLVATLVLPIFFLIGIFTTPKQSVSPMYFGISLLGVVALFVAIHSIYGVLKNGKIFNIKYAFFAFLLAFAFLGVKEKIAFGVTNHHHVLVLNEEYKVHKEEFLASMGIEPKAVSGEEIYNRCMACHKDVDSPTAPAHKNVMAKYLSQDDPKAALIKFVSNPVSVNKKWPPMPNQGLTPNEISAVVDYLIGKYGDKKQESTTPKDSVGTKL